MSIKDLPIKLSLFLVLGIITLVTYYGFNKIAKQKQIKKANQVLTTTLDELFALLPPPNTPNLQEQMPIKISGVLRDGLRYYPSLNAYKYTFLSNHYSVDILTIPANHRLIFNQKKWQMYGNNSKSYLPYTIERRSIWLKPSADKWLCYAGMSKDVQDLRCQDASIVQNLTKAQHVTAQRLFETQFNNCTRQIFSPSWVTQEAKTYIFDTQISNPEIYIGKTQGNLDPIGHYENSDVIVVLKSYQVIQPVTWNIHTTHDIRIMNVIILGNDNVTVQGLATERISDYPSVKQQCEQQHGDSYPKSVWDSSAKYFLSIIPSDNIITKNITTQFPSVMLGTTATQWRQTQLTGQYDSNKGQIVMQLPKQTQQSVTTIDVAPTANAQPMADHAKNIRERIGFNCYTQDKDSQGRITFRCERLVDGQKIDSIYAGEIVSDIPTYIYGTDIGLLPPPKDPLSYNLSEKDYKERAYIDEYGRLIIKPPKSNTPSYIINGQKYNSIDEITALAKPTHK